MNKLTLTALAGAMALAAAVPAQADVLLGAKVGADAWFTDAKINDSSAAADSHTSGSYYLALEHFIPLVPNVRLRYTNVDNGAVSFGQTDYTLYYEILDNDAIAFDLGLTMAKFNAGQFGAERFSEWQPALYGNVEVGIPMTPVSFFGDVNYGNYDSTRTLDALAGVKWTVPLVVDLNLRAGYRVMDYDFDFVRNGGDFKTDGWFAGVEIDL
ncbi:MULTISPECIES: TIGR04219 family outer membrane beta-barrel protein [Photobacterium]|uniref:ABC-type Fe3+-hydroxamate transport system, periplasmic component n=1 Tax=Photobacterium ganghwense TaxID=320778 RepID=A0A0J1GZ30_9GAMM|nr:MULTISPECIES: TIGR04219 family outer membrane beta-barrel protein [Photobacterium]KLV04896.1 ABC-type Fe3+-hydroxamate transport system, periplasmic component [Photobacterium ganghwense]MBV1840297.1 TIGR04219 family outer membrane beta-barrel protein [Photobacterium ganghwense]PSU04067.1 TIGR04219 family outer membrane beta-barrel protein [Photobacterium ganghwense]QSV13863.1 TIGR04219 family outer membrane beta-barrel protein [Photobacterium ganghwense]